VRKKYRIFEDPKLVAGSVFNHEVRINLRVFEDDEFTKGVNYLNPLGTNAKDAVILLNFEGWSGTVTVVLKQILFWTSQDDTTHKHVLRTTTVS